MTSPSLLLLADGESHFPKLTSIARCAKHAGPKIHDTRIAALCLAHGVNSLYNPARDFCQQN